jgi:hypothetical protein
MEIVFKWEIQQMETKPQEGELMDVVVAVYWRRQAITVIDEVEYIANAFNIMKCETPSPTDFTAYPDLTYDQVCGWLDNGVDVISYDNQLTVELDNLVNPPIIVLPNPWITPNPTPEPPPNPQ